jgi:putative Holliday junction resolvase
MKIISLDIGKKRIGVASCDALEIAASPHSMVKAGKTAAAEIARLVQREGAEMVVIGLATSFDGVEREACHRARMFKNELEALIEVPIDFYDERFTSKIAEQSLIQSGMRRENRKEHIDAVAAAIILRGYLDYRQNCKNKETREL